MTTVCLVHGAWHGAWCWDLLAPQLTARGFAVVAPDLPASDPSAGALRYAEVVTDALHDVDDDVVLIGHSLGGKTIPLVAERRPVAHLVYLTGLPPVPGLTLYEAIEHHGVELSEGFISIDNGDGTMSLPPEIPRPWFYGDVPDELARWAESMLRPQAALPMTERSPVLEGAGPGGPVPTSFIACAEDRALAPAGVHRVAAAYGAPVHDLPGSHSPFLSRPSALADLIIAISTPDGRPAAGH
jgi:pimeloyl-ACP methyl ester carboxylesterase